MKTACAPRPTTPANTSLRHTGPMWRSVRQQSGSSTTLAITNRSAVAVPTPSPVVAAFMAGNVSANSSSIAVTVGHAVPVARARIAPTAATISDPAGRRARRSRPANGPPGQLVEACKCTLLAGARELPRPRQAEHRDVRAPARGLVGARPLAERGVGARGVEHVVDDLEAESDLGAERPVRARATSSAGSTRSSARPTPASISCPS